MMLSIVLLLSILTLSSSWNMKRIIASSGLSIGLLISGNTEVRADFKPSPWDDKVLYDVVTSNPSGLKPKVGELVAIRFKGSFKGNVYDNTFDTPEPYFYRAGVGLIIKGLDDAIPNMHVGERIKLTFSGDRSFEKGKASSPGKPRIPPGAEVEYEVELTELPGAAEEFILDVE
jgi:FKBP-type peptidyl-prolyl cis-trans isomerase